MDTEYADAVNRLQDEVDMVCSKVLGPLTGKEIASELRLIAEQWEEEE